MPYAIHIKIPTLPFWVELETDIETHERAESIAQALQKTYRQKVQYRVVRE